jgi:D-serine deaminase-like pyridoxal phosphate-dependent protein
VKRVGDLRTPALMIERSALEANLAEMARARPGSSLRPHVKAHKTTALARLQREAGHVGFTCATVEEVVGMARAGLDDDLLLANEVVDVGKLAEANQAARRLTVAVDSAETIDAAANAGIAEVLVDVDVGLPRCGAPPEQARALAERARVAGLEVRGVMGYEGHLMMVLDPEERREKVRAAMAALLGAAAEVGGAVVSAGGTGTYRENTWATEIQAGSYLLMDTDYSRSDLPFANALFVLATVVSVTAARAGRPGWAVADAGLKAFSVEHGNPGLPGATVWFCSDEHTTFSREDQPLEKVGDRVRLVPSHVDPTMNLHPFAYLVDGDDVIERWPVDLRRA